MYNKYNKSNSTTGAVRMEANLRRTSAACAIYSKCITGKYLSLKMKVKVMEYNIRNGLIRW